MDTYEKKYKDALEKAKTMIDDLRKGEDILAVSELESMFPELGERLIQGTIVLSCVQRRVISLKVNTRRNRL